MVTHAVSLPVYARANGLTMHQARALVSRGCLLLTWDWRVIENPECDLHD